MGKIKILLVLTVVCSLMFGNVAMATEATTSGSSLVEIKNGLEGYPEFPASDYRYCFVLSDAKGTHLYYTTVGLHTYPRDGYCNSWYANAEKDLRFDYVYYVLDGDSWSYKTAYQNTGGLTFSNSVLLYANYGVKNLSTDEVFFQEAPSSSKTVAGLMPEQMAEMTMSEILTLIPIVLSVILLYLGLRKGLSFLWTLSRQA